MKFPPVRFVRVVTVLLWGGVIVLGAWLVAYHQRRDFADYSPSEQLDRVTPTHVLQRLALDGGTQTFEATARDGSYVVIVPRDASTPVLVELCTMRVDTVLGPGAPETAAVRRSLQRALDSGQLSMDSAGAARALGGLLGRGVATR